MNEPRFWLEVVVIIVGLVGSWVAQREQLANQRAKHEELCERVEVLEVDKSKHEREIALLKQASDTHSKELEKGLARIEGAIGTLHARFDDVLRDPRRTA